jgi:L-lactate transport
MWSQTYLPVGENLPLSSLVAALPILVLLLLLAVWRVRSWVAALSGLAVAAIVALFVYGMPATQVISSALYGAAFGILPIGWIVYTAILLYKFTVETGKFEIIRNSVGSLTGDRRLQALLIAFAFGAFIEGAGGFGTPVAVAAAMLAGLGFEPFYAAGICLLANTAPVAFGSIGIPVVTLAAVTNMSLDVLSSDVGRICAPVALFIPAYLILVMSGWKGLKGVLPAAAVCGIAFAGMQFFVSNFLGPYLTDILASLAAIICLVILFKIWKPKGAEAPPPSAHGTSEAILAWVPYALLVVFVLLWGTPGTKAILDKVTVIFPWPALHNLVQRVAPIAAKPTPYGATYTLNLLSASGTACLFAVIAAALVFRVSPRKLGSWTWATTKQLALPQLTICSMLALAYLMNYSGQTATLALAFSATGGAFPFFSSMLGWLGVFLTGSDTSANALFGNLQIVTANRLGFNPALMAAANSAGGVMGKMISLQSIAIAVVAAGMARTEESRLFRFTLRHSVFLASVVGVLTLVYAYVLPGWVR